MSILVQAVVGILVSVGKLLAEIATAEAAGKTLRMSEIFPDQNLNTIQKAIDDAAAHVKYGATAADTEPPSER